MGPRAKSPKNISIYYIGTAKVSIYSRYQASSELSANESKKAATVKK